MEVHPSSSYVVGACASEVQRQQQQKQQQQQPLLPTLFSRSLGAFNLQTMWITVHVSCILVLYWYIVYESVKRPGKQNSTLHSTLQLILQIAVGSWICRPFLVCSSKLSSGPEGKWRKKTNNFHWKWFVGCCTVMQWNRRVIVDIVSHFLLNPELGFSRIQNVIQIAERRAKCNDNIIIIINWA